MVHHFMADTAGRAYSGYHFDPRPLQALEAELAERIRARRGEFQVDAWEVKPFASVRAAPPARWAWAARDVIGVGLVAAALAIVAIPQGGPDTPAAVVPRTPPPRPLAPTPAVETLAAEALAPVMVTPARIVPPAEAAPSPAAAPNAMQFTSLASAEVAQPPVRSAYAANDAEPAFDCRPPFSFSEERVCGNSSLAELNSDLRTAFRQAEAAGVPLQELYRRQSAWAAMRDEAAYTAPGRLPGLYAQRIDELASQGDAADSGQP